MPRRLLSRVWTDDELTVLSELFNQGMSVRMIAYRLKRTPASVRGKLSKLGHRCLARRRSSRQPSGPAGVEARPH
jgi:DNA-binding NarL/FixJ family response regulator